MKHLLTLIGCVVFNATIALAQPGVIFYGGVGQGFVVTTLFDSNGIYFGADGDGFAMQVLLDSSGLFLGGANDGFASMELNDSDKLYEGGVADGFSTNTLVNAENIFRGAVGDGHVVAGLDSDDSIFRGNSGDGFAFTHLLHYHLWTGNVNSDWNNTNNWSGAVIPTIDLRVRIPNGRPNYPLLPTGSLHVGGLIGGPDYICKALRINNGGELWLGASTVLRNFTDIEVAGLLHSQNTTSTTIINRPGSTMTVRPTGTIVIQ